MKAFPLFIATWLLAGLGAVIGSILGNAAGKPGLFAGAVVGGLVGVALVVIVGSKLGWLLPTDRLSGFLGGSGGFAIAAPIAVSNLHTPITPILICALAGVGLLLGVGIGRGLRRVDFD